MPHAPVSSTYLSGFSVPIFVQPIYACNADYPIRLILIINCIKIFVTKFSHTWLRLSLSTFKIVYPLSKLENRNFLLWQKYDNFKLESAEIWILTYLTYVLTISVKVNSQIKNQMSNYRLLRASISGYVLMIIILTSVHFMSKFVYDNCKGM